MNDTLRTAMSPELLERRRLLAFDPSAESQEMLENVNRMRMDPQAELQVLFTSLDPLRARDAHAKVAVRGLKDPTAAEIRSEWPALQPAGPLAWNESLSAAATAHSQAMILHDRQSHQLPGESGLVERTRAAGYSGYSAIGENAFAFSRSVFHAHSAFAIDWGVPDRGHRAMIMDSGFREFGVGIVADASPSTSVGPLVVTQNFGSRFADGGPFLVGVVYRDANSNRRYDASEGIGGVSIQVTGPGATFTATTMSAGGYQIQVPSGSYTVVASGGGLVQTQQSVGVRIDASNVKVDFTVGSTTPVTVPPAPVDVAATPGNRRATVTWSLPAASGDQAVTRSTVQVSADGGSTWRTAWTGSGKSTHATVKGLANQTSYVFRVAASNGSGIGPYSAPSAAVAPSANRR